MTCLVWRGSTLGVDPHLAETLKAAGCHLAAACVFRRRSINSRWPVFVVQCPFRPKKKKLQVSFSSKKILQVSFSTNAKKKGDLFVQIFSQVSLSTGAPCMPLYQLRCWAIFFHHFLRGNHGWHPSPAGRVCRPPVSWAGTLKYSFMWFFVQPFTSV